MPWQNKEIWSSRHPPARLVSRGCTLSLRVAHIIQALCVLQAVIGARQGRNKIKLGDVVEVGLQQGGGGGACLFVCLNTEDETNARLLL